MALLDFSMSPHGGSQRHLPEWQSQPKITPTTIIDHSIVGAGESAWQMFATRSVLESHFIVLGRRSASRDGHIWQLMDTARQADANLDANGYAISIETEDDGDPDTQVWTGAQLRSLMWLHAELRRIHPTIPQRESRSCADPGGLGYHTLHGAPSCWTPVAKSCPGTVRKRQWRDVLLPGYLAGTPILEDDMYDADAEARLFQRIEESERRTARYVDHGDAAVTGSGNHHVRVREDVAATNAALAQLGVQVAELTQLVKGLALGKVEGDVELVGEFTGTAHVTTPVPPAPVADVELA